MSIVSKNLSGNPFFCQSASGAILICHCSGIFQHFITEKPLWKKIRNYGKSRENTKRGEILVENKNKK